MTDKRKAPNRNSGGILRSMEEMRSYLDRFFETFSYPDDAREFLMQAYLKGCENENIRQLVDSILQNYGENHHYNFWKTLPALYEQFAAEGVHEYTAILLLFICMTKPLKEHYLKQGLSESMWFTAVQDLKWKMDECKCMHNIWGTFVAGWFGGFFHMHRFSFGKLQFETFTFGKTLEMFGMAPDVRYQKDGVTLDADTVVIPVHIPRTGTRLDKESLESSYKEAADFYKNYAQNGKVLFVCHSWLLFPRNKEVLSESSNLYRFISNYDIFAEGVYKDYSESWRLFDVEYKGDVDQLPQNTSLRRAYADWIRKGEKTGWGYGVYAYRIQESEK